MAGDLTTDLICYDPDRYWSVRQELVRFSSLAFIHWRFRSCCWIVSLFLDQELISCRYLSCCSFSLFLWRPSTKKCTATSFQIGAGWNLARLFCKCIDWQSRIFDLTSHFKMSGHDVISHRKVLPPSECSRSFCPVHMRQCLPVHDPLYIRTCSCLEFL